MWYLLPELHTAATSSESNTLQMEWWEMNSEVLSNFQTCKSFDMCQNIKTDELKGHGNKPYICRLVMNMGQWLGKRIPKKCSVDKIYKVRYMAGGWD